MWALISFIGSFAVARAFTSLNPTTVIIVGNGFHIHHFWFGIVMLAVGGWLGISYDNERINRLAAILFGAGGGFIGDEFGLLLTFENYWTELTYTLVITFLAIASILIFIIRYSKTVEREFAEFFRSNASLYIGVFLEAVSIAFFMETSNITINAIAAALAVSAFMIIVAYFVHRITKRQQTKDLQTENA